MKNTNDPSEDNEGTISYLTWDKSPWKATLFEDKVFNHLSAKDNYQSIDHREKFIKYIAYNGEAWTAFPESDSNGWLIFHHKRSDEGAENYSRAIRYLGWDGTSQWMAHLDDLPQPSNHFYQFTKTQTG